VGGRDFLDLRQARRAARQFARCARAFRNPSEPDATIHVSDRFNERHIMKAQQSEFVRQYLGVVLASLVPVVLTAFLSIPFTLGGNPGDVRSAQAEASAHMT
jgi:hypothetical protein